MKNTRNTYEYWQTRSWYWYYIIFDRGIGIILYAVEINIWVHTVGKNH